VRVSFPSIELGVLIYEMWLPWKEHTCYLLDPWTGAWEVTARLSQNVQWGELKRDGWDVGHILSRTIHFQGSETKGQRLVSFDTKVGTCLCP